MSLVPQATFGVVHQEQEVHVTASAERVWTALTKQLGEWWPTDFLINAEAKSFVLEARLGGRLYEDWGEGQGATWGTVTGLKNNVFLQLSGELSLEFQGPARTLTTIRLAAADGGTRVSLSEVAYGSVDDTNAQAMAEGWSHILNQCLKPFAERA